MLFWSQSDNVRVFFHSIKNKNYDNSNNNYINYIYRYPFKICVSHNVDDDDACIKMLSFKKYLFL